MEENKKNRDTLASMHRIERSVQYKSFVSFKRRKRTRYIYIDREICTLQIIYLPAVKMQENGKNRDTFTYVSLYMYVRYSAQVHNEGTYCT